MQGMDGCHVCFVAEQFFRVDYEYAACVVGAWASLLPLCVRWRTQGGAGIVRHWSINLLKPERQSVESLCELDSKDKQPSARDDGSFAAKRNGWHHR